MNLIYPFFISFAMVFISELGDKTQLLVLSFSGKDKTYKILLGVAIGSFFSHGIAILFGSQLGLLENEMLHNIVHFITYASFIFMGILTFLPKNKDAKDTSHPNFIYKLTHMKINYCILIALCIMVGELGDKTFLASIGLGIGYPNFKVPLILGAICAMVLCDFIAILFGKFLNQYVSEKMMEKISGVLFLLFGFIGFLQFCFG